MSLSCSTTSGWDCERWCYYFPNNFTVYKNKKSCRCESCGDKISPNDQVVEFTRFRVPKNEIEAKIFGYDGEIKLASWFMCELCGEIYLNLVSLGFCPDIEESMHDLLEEYQEEYAHPAWESFKKYDFKR